MSTEKKPRKSPVPQSAERIKEGAIKLSLQDKVDLVKTLQEAIAKEVADKKREADEAAKIAGA